MISKATEVRLDPETRAVLEGWVRASTTEQRKVKRAHIVLLAAEGWPSRRIAREIGVMTGVVSVWRKRFAASGIEGLEDKPRPGAKPVYTQETDKRILAMLDQPVPKGRARWDGKLVAKALGDVDVNYVRRFLGKQKIDLAGRKSWCESKDPEFAAKAADVVGL
jgi:transposase